MLSITIRNHYSIFQSLFLVICAVIYLFQPSAERQGRQKNQQRAPGECEELLHTAPTAFILAKASREERNIAVRQFKLCRLAAPLPALALLLVPPPAARPTMRLRSRRFFLREEFFATNDNIRNI